MIKRLSSNWVIWITAIIVFPLTAVGIWMQDNFSLPNWLYGLWYLFAIVLCVEVLYRIGPEGVSRSFFDVTGLSFKDKAIYRLSVIAMIAGVIVVSEFLKDIGTIAIITVLIVIFVGLYYLPARLFGSPELKEKIFGKKK